jgi:hypothetical protein
LFLLGLAGGGEAGLVFLPSFARRGKGEVSTVAVGITAKPRPLPGSPLGKGRERTGSLERFMKGKRMRI